MLKPKSPGRQAEDKVKTRFKVILGQGQKPAPPLNREGWCGLGSQHKLAQGPNESYSEVVCKIYVVFKFAFYKLNLNGRNLKEFLSKKNMQKKTRVYIIEATKANKKDIPSTAKVTLIDGLQNGNRQLEKKKRWTLETPSPFRSNHCVL